MQAKSSEKDLKVLISENKGKTTVFALVILYKKKRKTL